MIAAGLNEKVTATEPATPKAITRELEICNKKGLHARASAKFVQTVEKFDADVKVTRGQESVGGTSIMGLMMLAAGVAIRPRRVFFCNAKRRPIAKQSRSADIYALRAMFCLCGAGSRCPRGTV